MRIVLDLQACQAPDGGGEPGRLSLEFARAVARRAQEGDHWVCVVLSGSLPDRIPALRRAFAGLLPPEQIATCSLPPARGGTSEPSAAWRRRATTEIRGAFLESLRPDVVYVSGLHAALAPDEPGAAAPSGYALCGTLWASAAVTRREVAAFDLVFAASDEASRDALAGLALPPERVVKLDEGADEAGWDAAATLALDVFARLASARAAGVERPAPISPARSRRRRLAFVSPLPPARSGIADYSAELLPELSKFYDIDVVLQQDRVATPGSRRT